MFRRLLSDLLFVLMKVCFREKKISSDLKTNKDQNHSPCEYRVIGIRPQVQDLAESIINQHRHVEFFGFNGFTQRLSTNLVDQDASMIIHGRKLSNGEIGCARSHQLAYLVPTNSDWTIFLEDDVRIDGDLSVIEEQLNRLSLKPTVVFLNYGPEDFVRYPFWKKKHCTHAYALNKSALDVIRNTHTEIICVADWPIQWVYQLDFLVLSQGIIKLNQEIDSLIESERSKSKKEGSVGDALMAGSAVRIGVNMFSLYRLLKRKGVKNSAITAFVASKSGLYSGGSE